MLKIACCCISNLVNMRNLTLFRAVHQIVWNCVFDPHGLRMEAGFICLQIAYEAKNDRAHLAFSKFDTKEIGVIGDN